MTVPGPRHGGAGRMAQTVSPPRESWTPQVLARFKKILVPELNGGQLCWLLRAKYLVPAESLSKVQGKPFLVSEIEHKIEQMLA